MLEDLKDKAETELAEARKAESTTKHNYAMTLVVQLCVNFRVDMRTIIPAFADKSEGPHTQQPRKFDQTFGPQNVKKTAQK